MPFKCCVTFCDKKNTPLHCFPKDADVFRHWCVALGRNELLQKDQALVRKSFRVCDAHFAEDQKFKAYHNRSNLIQGAIPSVHLPAGFKEVNNSCLDVLQKITDNLQQGFLNTTFKKPFVVTETDLQSPGKNIKFEINPNDDIQATDSGAASEPERPIIQSIKSYLQDAQCITEVCRICFRAIIGTQMIRLQDGSIESAQKVKEMLTSVLPELDLDIYPKAVICMRCCNLLTFSAELKEIYKSTEDKLNKIVNDCKNDKKKDSDLIILAEATTKYDRQESLKFTFGIDDDNSVINEHNYAANAVCSCTTKENIDIEIPEHNIDTDEFGNEIDTVKSRKKVHISWGSGPFICEICGFQCTKPIIIKNHLYRHSYLERQRKYQDMLCEQCGKVSNSRAKFLYHKKQHLKKKIIMCERCGQVFNCRVTFRRHKRRHLMQNNKGLPPKTHKCGACDKTFKNALLLQRHVKGFHLKIYDYQCEICAKRFTNGVYLKNHQQIHNSERKYFCQICGMTFKQRSSLSKHSWKHNGDRMFQCEMCDRQIKYARHLKRHMQIFHSDGWKFTCEVCRKPYWKKIDLDKHRFQIHELS